MKNRNKMNWLKKADTVSNTYFSKSYTDLSENCKKYVVKLIAGTINPRRNFVVKNQ